MAWRRTQGDSSLKDLIEWARHSRVARTFVQAFLAVLVASGTGLVSVATITAAAVAGLAAVAAYLHSVVDAPE